MSKLLSIGEKAPGFSLPDQDNKEHKLSDYLGKWVLVYFYPKDDTPGCTKEACAIRDTMPKFNKLSLEVLGVSADPASKHKKFIDKYSLNFTLLSDEDKNILKEYGVWDKKKMMGKEYMGIKRTSYLISPEGKIAKVYDKVKPAIHAEEVLEDMKELINNKRK